jgi:hypothetical protein
VVSRASPVAKWVFLVLMHVLGRPWRFPFPSAVLSRTDMQALSMAADVEHEHEQEHEHETTAYFATAFN